MPRTMNGDHHLSNDEIALLALDGLTLQLSKFQETLDKICGLIRSPKATRAPSKQRSEPVPAKKKKAKWSAEQREAAALRMKKMWAEKRKNERARKFKKAA